MHALVGDVEAWRGVASAARVGDSFGVCRLTTNILSHAIKVEERKSEGAHTAEALTALTSALRIKPGKMKVAVTSQGKLSHVVTYEIENSILGS